MNNEKMNSLENNYKKGIQEFSTQLIDQTEEDILSTELTPQQIRTTIHNQKIRSLINNCRQSLEIMGKNQKLMKTSWFERLDEENQELFKPIDRQEETTKIPQKDKDSKKKNVGQAITDEAIRKVNNIIK